MVNVFVQMKNQWTRKEFAKFVLLIFVHIALLEIKRNAPFAKTILFWIKKELVNVQKGWLSKKGNVKFMFLVVLGKKTEFVFSQTTKQI